MHVKDRAVTGWYGGNPNLLHMKSLAMDLVKLIGLAWLLCPHSCTRFLTMYVARSTPESATDFILNNLPAFITWRFNILRRSPLTTLKLVIVAVTTGHGVP